MLTLAQLLDLSDSGTVGIRVRWGHGEETCIWVAADIDEAEIIAQKSALRDAVIAGQKAAAEAIPVEPTEEETRQYADSLQKQLDKLYEQVPDLLTERLEVLASKVDSADLEALTAKINAKAEFLGESAK